MNTKTTQTEKDLIVHHGSVKVWFPIMGQEVRGGTRDSGFPLEALLLIYFESETKKYTLEGEMRNDLKSTVHDYIDEKGGLSVLGKELCKDNEAVLEAALEHRKFVADIACTFIVDQNAPGISEKTKDVDLTPAGLDDNAVEGPHGSGAIRQAISPDQKDYEGNSAATYNTLSLSIPVPVAIVKDVGQLEIMPSEVPLAIAPPHCVDIDKLKIHPKRERYYPQHEPHPGLLLSMSEIGQLEPVITDRNYFIIKGCHKWAALKKLSIKKVTIVVLNVDMDNINCDEVLHDYHIRKNKDNEGKIRQFAGHYGVETVKARERMLAGKHPLVKSPEGSQENGNARDISGKKAGIDGKLALAALKVLMEIDKRAGQPEAEKVRKSFNQSLTKGIKDAANYGWPDTVPKGNVSRRGAKTTAVEQGKTANRKTKSAEIQRIESEQKPDLEWITPEGITVACAQLQYSEGEKLAINNLLISIAPVLLRVKRLSP